MIDIVIPHYGSDQLLQRCLASIEQVESPPARVIVHDNNQGNIGFAGGVNAAVTQGTSPYIVILNNDTVVTDGWLDSLRALLDSDHRLAAVGPLSTAPTQWQGVEPMRAWLQAEVPQPGFVTTADGCFPSNLAFWCVMIRRAVWRDVGELDAGYFMYGEDEDWCLRAKAKGYELAVDLSCVVHHDHRANYTEATRRHHENSRNRFRQRWEEAYEPRHWSIRLAANEIRALPIRRLAV